MSVLAKRVLVLNRSYLPVNVTSTRRALSLLYQDMAHAVDDRYRTFDFATWSTQAVSVDDESVGLVDRMIRVPRVVLLLRYDRMPRRSVRFTRFNIYARDCHRCQYCGCRLLRSELNLDHVVPRSRGGASTWDNVVCSCRRCNRTKGGRTPEVAGMHLRRRPFRPKWSPFLVDEVSRKRYKEWLPYLGTVDGTWRNLEETERSAG
jgi:5-methylcytosine-specific restriction endonuclease McrA